jgi:hypothetical protein
MPHCGTILIFLCVDNFDFLVYGHFSFCTDSFDFFPLTFSSVSTRFAHFRSGALLMESLLLAACADVPGTGGEGNWNASSSLLPFRWVSNAVAVTVELN